PENHPYHQLFRTNHHTRCLPALLRSPSPTSRGGCDHLISPLRLCLVECHVRTLEQCLRTIFVRVLCGAPDACRYVERLAAAQSERPVSNFCANALGNLSCGRKLGVRHDNDELLTAIAADEVDAAKISLESQRDFLQHLIAYGMA